MSNSATLSQWSLCPVDEDPRKAAHVNGLQAPAGPALACSPRRQCMSPECSEQPVQTEALPGPGGQSSPTAAAAGEECQQIVPHREVVDLKAQLQRMENLISSSQETIRVFLGSFRSWKKERPTGKGFPMGRGKAQVIVTHAGTVDVFSIVWSWILSSKKTNCSQF